LEFNIDYSEKGAQQITPEQVELFKQAYQDAMEGLENSWQKSKTQLRK
jgi:HKD family nuclease